MPTTADFSYFTTEYTMMNLQYWETYVFVILIPLVFVAGKSIFGLFMRLHVDGFNLSKELVEDDNKAVCVGLAGMEVAVGLVAYGALADKSSTEHWTNLYSSIVWFIIGLLFLVVFMVLADKLTFRAMNIREEVKKGNVSAALVLASSFISGGIVSRFTCGGGGTDWSNTVPSALLFFVLCIAAFTSLDFLIILLSWRFGNPFEALGDDNYSAGVLLFCARISIAVIVTNPLSSSEELVAFVVWLVIAVVVLVALDFLVTFFIVSRSDSVAEFQSRSWGGSLVHGACLLAFAYAIASFIPNTCSYDRAVEGVSLKDRLVMLTSTKALLQWPNIVYAATIMLYMCLARFVFCIPGLLKEPLRNWKQVVTLYLAESNVRRSLRKRGVKSGRAAKVAQDSDDGVLTEVASAVDLPPPPSQQPPMTRESSTDNLVESDVRPAESIRTPDRVMVESEEDLDCIDCSDCEHEANQDDFGSCRGSIEGGAVKEPSMIFDDSSSHEGSTTISAARAVVFSGFIIGIGITLRACFAVTSGSTKGSYVAYTYFWIGISMLMLTFGFYFQRFLIWGSKLEPAPRRNVAAGIMQACMFVCVALQTGNNLTAFQEPGDFDLGADVMGTLIYFVIQMVLVGIAGVALQWLTPFNDKDAVKRGNAAAAITNGGKLIAIAVLASAPATKTYELLAFALFFVVTVICMYGCTFVIVRFVMFAGRSVNKEVSEDRNWGATLVEVAVAIGIASCYTTFLKEFCTPTTVAAITTNTTSNITSV